jgi:SAM-dependent methyltransferase
MTTTSEGSARPFRGVAPYYVQGRLPYASGLADALARALGLNGRGKLLDVGCGPGVVALRVAHLFEEIVGIDIDPDMLAEAARRAEEEGITKARWIQTRAEELPAGLGPFRVATFGRSFHWMDHERLVPVLFDALEPGGAFVVLSEAGERSPEPGGQLPHPEPPRAAIEEVLERYLGGPERRTGHRDRIAAVLRDVPPILDRAGFIGPTEVRAEGGEPLVRTTDDVIAFYYSHSHSAPPLFGDRLAAFEAEIRRVLADASPPGLFSVRTRDTRALVWHKPTP